MKHQTPYRLNETSLSPVRERGMVYRGEVITLSIDQRDEPFYILIRHAGDFTFVINRKQCYLNRVIVVLNEIECDNTSAPALAFPPSKQWPSAPYGYHYPNQILEKDRLPVPS